MTGTYDHRQERLRSQADEELRSRPPLPSWQRRVVERFAMERGNGWYTLLNRFAPRTPSSRPDVVLAGPLGVFVVLLREEEPHWETSRAAFVWTAELLAGAATPKGLLTEAALRTVVVRPDGVPGHLEPSGEHLVVSAGELERILDAGERILDPADALAAALHLDNRTFELTPLAWQPQRIPEQRGAGQQTSSPRPPALFEWDDHRQQQMDHALNGTFRDWRFFLDDTQLGIVRRHYGGPARITGPAGTGKSVLALHRLAHLARRNVGQLLYTTHLHNLPEIARRQFASLAPQLTQRVEFTNLHAWAQRFLAERGQVAEVDHEAVDAAFRAVWERMGRSGPLGAARASGSYWKDEIDRVIKGRGIGTLESYRSASRRGRGTKVTPAFRSHVWEFYCEYERELSERGVYDDNDVLMRALDELARRPLPRPYSAVVVDEVQDLTLVGLRLAHAISGDAPDQLLLIGDGEQQVRAGGWRLSEAGIALQGRGEVLRRNYRNRTAIVDLAGQLEAVNRFDDLDGGPTVTLRASLPMLDGGQTVQWHGTAQEDTLVDRLREITATTDTDVAVLTHTASAAEHWTRVLTEAGFACDAVESWHGGSTDTVRIGTLHQAKGTEFRAVFLPDEHGTGTNGHRDRQEVSLRQRLMAITRAREYVWIGYLEPPAVIAQQ